MPTKTGRDLIHYKVTRLGCTVSFNGAVGQMSRQDPKFAEVVNAIAEDDMDKLAELVLPSYALARYSEFELGVVDGQLTIAGRKLPEILATDILELYHDGLPYEHLTKFWRRLCRNPSPNSIEQLYSFMRRNNLPVTPDGCVAAYKSVRMIDEGRYSSQHDPEFEYRIGEPASEPRERVVDDPNMACGPGLHVGSYEYAADFYGTSAGSAMLIVVVDPADVVSVPTDLGYVKCRACRLYPVEETKTPLSGRRYTPPINLALDPVDLDLDIADVVAPSSIDESDNDEVTEWTVKIGNYKYEVRPTRDRNVITDEYRLLLPSEMPKFFRELGMALVLRKKENNMFYYIAEDHAGNMWTYNRI